MRIPFYLFFHILVRMNHMLVRIKWCFILLFLLSCGSVDRGVSSPQKNKKILCTIAQIGDLVKAVGGERVSTQVLVQGELNPHSYELVKGDDEKITQADLIVYQGLGLEHGASVGSMLSAHRNTLAVGEAVRALYPEKILWKGPVPDPHLWMDVSLWKEAVDPITERLIALDPEGEQQYLTRAERLKEQMRLTDLEVEALLYKIPEEKRYLVTSHDAFHYFARRYLAKAGELDWAKRFAAPEGLAPDGQLNPLDLQKIVDHLANYRIQVLFPESNVSKDSIRKIAAAGKELGLSVRICKEALYGDALRGNYLDAMKHNAMTIARHLDGQDE